MDTEYAVSVENLVKIYRKGNIRALDSVSFTVEKGEVFSLLGPNGAGKTTAVKILTTLMKPTSGRVRIFGKDIHKNTDEVRKMIDVCPQDFVFYEGLTVKENLIFFGKMAGVPGNILEERTEKLVEMVGLTEKLNTTARRLSGGMKRRLNLILAFVKDPELVFLDEPTAGLDPSARHIVWDFIFSLKKAGKTVFLTTHYMEEADILSDRVAILDRGKIIALGTPFDLKRKYSRGDIIEVKFSNPAAEVENVLSSPSFTDIIDKKEYVEEARVFRFVIGGGLSSIGRLFDKFESAGLSVTDMNVRSNSLENVFLTLTGRKIAADGTPGGVNA